MSAPLFLDENTLRNDKPAIEMRDRQNVGISKYTTENYGYNWPVQCHAGEQRTPNFLYDHPNLRPRIGVGLSDDCTVDTLSSLWNSEMTHDRCKIQLFERVFTGVPNLRPGRVDPGEEMPLQQGVDNATFEGSILPCKKTLNEVPWKEFDPLLPCVKTVQDVEHVVEENIRCGISTRNFEIRQQYLKNCGYYSQNQVKLH
jgi:hypothetical protein